MGGAIHEISTRLQDRLEVTALVSSGLCASPESALASLFKIPVVSEEWIYASLEKGYWDTLKPHILISTDRVNNLPFKGMRIYLHGQPDSHVDIEGVGLIVTSGGGVVTSRMKTATIVVAFRHFKKQTNVPVVEPDWLYSCAHSLELLSVEDYYATDDSSSESQERASKKPAAKSKKVIKNTNSDSDSSVKPKPKRAKRKPVKKRDSSSDSEPKVAAKKKKPAKKTVKPADSDSDSSSAAAAKCKRKPVKKRDSSSDSEPKVAAKKKKPAKKTVKPADSDSDSSSAAAAKCKRKPVKQSKRKVVKQSDSNSDSESEAQATRKKLARQPKKKTADEKSTRKVIKDSSSSSHDESKGRKGSSGKETCLEDNEAQIKRASDQLPVVVGKQVNRFADCSSEEVKSASEDEMEMPALSETPKPPLKSDLPEDKISQDLCDSDGDEASEFSGVSLDDFDVLV